MSYGDDNIVSDEWLDAPDCCHGIQGLCQLCDGDDYDWAEDETLNYEQTMKIVDALGHDVEITGPNASRA